jgi:hypothetical protein
MVKRDTIQRYKAELTPDGMGGNIVNLTPAELVDAHVSINATLGEITQYGVKDQLILHIITNVELDDYIYTRYKYGDKFYKMVRQIKQGNEYFSTFVEVNEGGKI